MCLKDIGLQTPNLLTFLDSIINIIGGHPFNELEKAHSLLINEIFISAPKAMRQIAMDTIWNRQSFHSNCMFYFLGEVAAELKMSI